jgi:hypothetical protein
MLLLVEDYPIRKRVFCKKDFGWIGLWKLNPEVLGSLWLTASSTWGKITSAEGLHDCGRRAVPPFELYLGISLTTEEKHGNPRSG